MGRRPALRPATGRPASFYEILRPAFTAKRTLKQNLRVEPSEKPTAVNPAELIVINGQSHDVVAAIPIIANMSAQGHDVPFASGTIAINVHIRITYHVN